MVGSHIHSPKAIETPARISCQVVELVRRGAKVFLSSSYAILPRLITRRLRLVYGLKSVLRTVGSQWDYISPSTYDYF